MLFGLIIWLIWFFGIVPFDTRKLVSLWSSSDAASFSIFGCSVIITILLLYMVVFDLIVAKISNETINLATMLGYFFNLILILAIAYFLYGFWSHPINNSILIKGEYAKEPIDTKWLLLGRILEKNTSGCEDETRICWLVELQNGDIVKINKADDIYGNESEIISILKVTARYSGKTVLQPDSYVSADDTELFWRSVKYNP